MANRIRYFYLLLNMLFLSTVVSYRYSSFMHILPIFLHKPCCNYNLSLFQACILTPTNAKVLLLFFVSFSLKHACDFIQVNIRIGVWKMKL